MLPFGCIPFLLYEQILCGYIDAIESTFTLENLTFPVFHHQHTHIDSPLEDLARCVYVAEKNMAQIICRFADDAALLTHIGIMIQGQS